MKRIPLIDVFETPAYSIIHSIERFDVPWKNNNYSVPNDMDYVYNHSATRLISRMVFILLNTNEKLTQNAIDILAETIYKMYSRKWNKLYETFNLQYNPLENYDMTEEMTDDTTERTYGHTTTRTDNLTHRKTGTETTADDTTVTRTDNLTHHKTGTETTVDDTTVTRTDNLTHSKTGTETTVDDNETIRTDNLKSVKLSDVQGFNSIEYQPSNKEDLTNTGTQRNETDATRTITHNTTDTDTGTETNVTDGEKTITHNTTDADTGTETNVTDGEQTLTHNTTDNDTGTQTHAESGKDTDVRNYTLTRHGNIGVTTSQQMIESERNLWEFYFTKTVYADIDRVLTIDYYL